jgi:hypothetical protein
VQFDTAALVVFKYTVMFSMLKSAVFGPLIVSV